MPNIFDDAVDTKWEAKASLVADWDVWQIWTVDHKVCVADFLPAKKLADYIVNSHNLVLAVRREIQHGVDVPYMDVDQHGITVDGTFDSPEVQKAIQEFLEVADA